MDLKIREFHADLDYFVTFFRHNERFVPEGAKFTLLMGQSVHGLRGLGQVNQAKELFFRGTVTLHLMKRYLDAVMMFELWNSWLTCSSSTNEDEHSDECQRLKAIVRHNPDLFAHQGLKDGVFKSDSDCLSRPRSADCTRDWDRARAQLNQRMQLMTSRFEEIIKKQLRQYFAERPALSPAALSSTRYNREEIVQAMSSVQRTLMLEVNQRNRQLLEELGRFMSAEMVARFREALATEQSRLAATEKELRRALAETKAQLAGLQPMTPEQVRELIQAENATDRVWEEAFGASGARAAAEDRAAAATAPPENEAHVDAALQQVEGIQRQLQEAFGLLDSVVGVMEGHQARVAEMVDQMRLDYTNRIVRLDEQLREAQNETRQSSSEVHARLAALERNFTDNQDLLAQSALDTERLAADLAATQDKLRRLDHFRVRLLSLLANILFLGLLTVLCELPIRTLIFEPT